MFRYTPGWLARRRCWGLRRSRSLSTGSRRDTVRRSRTSFKYLAGARNLAATGSLNASFYHAEAILQKGYPHQDDHAPGYVILLGALIALVGGGYWTAVALNAFAYLAMAALVWALGRALGLGERVAWLGGACCLLLPVYLPYVYWVMAEVVLAALFLAALVLAVRFRGSWKVVVLAALVFGVATTVRESMLLTLPVFLAVLRPRRFAQAFAPVVLAFMLVVFWPLSRDRAPGGANMWAPTSGKAFAFQAVQAAGEGRWMRASRVALERARRNYEELAADTTTGTERGVLALFALLPLWAWTGWRKRTSLERRLLLGLTVTWLVMIVLILFVYVVGRWSGLRYLMFVMPAFLPWIAAGPDGGKAAPAVYALACGALTVSTLGILNDFKESRLRRQSYYADYVDRHIDPREVSRAVFPRGFLYGLRHPRVEVILDLPRGGGGGLRAFERVIGFELLVVSRGHELSEELDGRLKYRRLNHSPGADLLIYRRLN